MKWIVVAILACILPYTWLNWHFRKDEKAFEPYADMSEQANAIRLLSHGYQRVTIPAERLETPPVAPAGSAQSVAVPADYPAGLAQALAEPPALPRGYRSLATPFT